MVLWVHWVFRKLDKPPLFLFKILYFFLIVSMHDLCKLAYISPFNSSYNVRMSLADTWKFERIVFDFFHDSFCLWDELFDPPVVKLVALFIYLLNLLIEVFDHISDSYSFFWSLPFNNSKINQTWLTDSFLRESFTIFERLSIQKQVYLAHWYFRLH